ncbi:MAG: ThuA domain-containing protein [Bryobacterales bacterium]|nr:ThuA domain-containing protein [Bryobacterales bacterium]
MRLVRIAAWCLAMLLVLAAAASFHPMVRSVYRAINPSTSYDTEPPAVPELGDPAVLVFSKTNGFRHVDAIQEGVKALRGIAERRDWSLFHTENGAVFDTPILSRVRALVWLNASGAPLSTSQRNAMRGWIEGGGGFVGIHAALDDSHSSWEWYQRTVVGAKFIGHTMDHPRVPINVERRDHPAVAHLGYSWEWADEWYSFDRSVRNEDGVQVLASLDESTYDPRMKLLWMDEDIAMGDHPIIWTREVGAGRAFLSALGHNGSAFQAEEYQGVLEGAIAWAARLGDPGTERRSSETEE